MTERDRPIGCSTCAVLRLVLVTVVVGMIAAGVEAQTLQTIRVGEVVSVDEVQIVERPTGRGAQTGATVGSIAGYAAASHGDRWLGSLLGGALGGAAGGAAEKASKKRPGLQLVVRLDNGEEVGVQIPLAKKKKNQQTFNPGDRVRLMTGADGTTQVTPAST
jgi:outer membrane lipoprotein SlyB